MFDSKHYVPILKWKRAEQGALKALTDEDKTLMTPVIQFVMPKPAPQDQLTDLIKRFEKQALQIPEKLLEVWGTAPLFVDISLLFTTPLKIGTFNTILLEGKKQGAFLIPVIHLDDARELKTTAISLARQNNTGLCIRLICPDFSDTAKMNEAITDLLSMSKLEEKNVDLLVDIKETEENGNKYNKYLSKSQAIRNLSKFRTFTFASGSFPQNLTDYKIDEENLIPRIDWQSWNEQIKGKKLLRKPAFADYSIQYPIYKEALQFFAPTSSIKYTLENDWLIMKGKKQKFDLYLASAAVLVKDERFYGDNFSFGDGYIAEKAKHFEKYIKKPSIKGTGSTETWLRAGINHHLVLVARQVANLS